eukprot:CAMPEP_0113561246 /NCGR_PEP_ID=MMETSP0015_2-20120614/19874_1 /TAXON_ID=2838 /ORGANISM="Odontella" /LENGTH=311 /DNA_ID=CAMNT_0000463029 /DNA_START=229 /DNA_END=1164 /DNA_ORIENTATION=- /assembly_acc=CAM_ASM_000160
MVTYDGRNKEMFEDDWTSHHFISSASPTKTPASPVPSSQTSDKPTRAPIIPHTFPPSAKKTANPTVAPTVHPSPSPTITPTENPTVAPTARAENEADNGGCEANEYLFALFMYDQGGDGWEKAKISIAEENVFGFRETVFKGGLEDGKSGMEYVCLELYTCYHAVIQGGLWEKEIRWELKPVVLGTTDEYKIAIAKGAAPAECSFSFGNPRYPVCETTCLSWNPPTPAPTERPTPAPTVRPTTEPSGKPTSAPTWTPTKAPTGRRTSAPTTWPTRRPTKVPTSIPTHYPTYYPTELPTDLPSNRPNGLPML